MAPAERKYTSASEILAALPHRAPFLFVDKVDSLKVGQAIRTVKNVTHGDVCGDGAVPSLPSLFLLECFGQASVLLVASERREGEGNLEVLLGTTDSFESLGDVYSGDIVEIDVHFEKRTSKLAILEGRALVCGMPVAQARFTAYFDWND